MITNRNRDLSLSYLAAKDTFGSGGPEPAAVRAGDLKEQPMTNQPGAVPTPWKGHRGHRPPASGPPTPQVVVKTAGHTPVFVW
jgi:hypothetical protein